MSVLNQSGEEQVECPLCMEPLEVDDLTFFPCTCGYQICRFCWHRIRTDENGLCPACRKAYSEDPADFIPLSQEQISKLKAEKRQRDQQRKAKLTESRKHLASVRVVQRNLVFVVGLPMRLADPEVLKRHEYFGKFGKIHKVVINQSTAYAGSQGPSASAYVTYMKSDDALRAIQSVNNITIEGRVIKSSLGTTKYCSHFMKNQTCPKPDCMYLHDYGDPEASFTKEQMHAGKHQEYEKKLHENLLLRTANNNNAAGQADGGPAASAKSAIPIPKSSSKENVGAPLSSSVSSSSSTTSNSSGTNKENWPNLNNGDKEKKDKEKGKKAKGKDGGDAAKKADRKEAYSGKSDGKIDKGFVLEDKQDKTASSSSLSEASTTPSPASLTDVQILPKSKIASIIDDNTSFFSMNPFQKITQGNHAPDNVDNDSETTHPASILTDTLPNINTTEDWAAAFGFSRNSDVNSGKKDEKDVLGSFRKGYEIGNQDTGYNKDIEPYSNSFYEMSSRMQENIIDMIASKSNPLYKQAAHPQVTTLPNHTHNGLNGLDQNMSKYFMEFHKNNKDGGSTGQHPQYYGYNGVQQGYYSGMQNNSERMMLLQQKQLEEQFLNLSLKQGFGSLYPKGADANFYMNGENGGFGGVQGPQYNNSSNVKQCSKSPEDDLGFDPFQETQKAFADLMASEQNLKSHNNIGRSQINGVNLNQNGHLPPPPPGFVQQNSHMNSFGSKILPYLNMSNSQQQQPQQQINSSTQNNWSSNFNSHLQQQEQKNINNTCNDWKVLDPAILSSSRYYPQLRDHYSNLSQVGLQQIQNGGAASLRPYEYTNNAFSNFTQLQPNFNNYSHLNSQQNVNWFSNDINSQITSPPGFRNNPATKQQEC